MDVIKLKQVITSGLIVSGILLTMPVLAASSCKGLIESDCASSTSCGWINGYTRKDGIVVKSFCRSKPGRKLVEKKVLNNKAAEKKTGEKKTDEKKIAEKAPVEKTGKSKPAS